MTISNVQYLHDLQTVGLDNDLAKIHAQHLEFMADEMKKEIRQEISNCIREHDLARKIDIRETEIRLIKWMIGVGFGLVGLMSSIMFEFFKLFVGLHT